MAKVAMLVGEGFEDSEFRVPYDQLRRNDHEVDIIGSEANQTVEGKRHRESVRIMRSAGDADPNEYHALVIPGGFGPDRLRTDDEVVEFIRAFFRTNRPIAAVCHGPQLLIEADLVRGRTMTSWPSVRTDLINAGADWVDREVVEDGPFITSRKPEDLEAFSSHLLARLQ